MAIDEAEWQADAVRAELGMRSLDPRREWTEDDADALEEHCRMLEECVTQPDSGQEGRRGKVSFADLPAIMLNVAAMSCWAVRCGAHRAAVGSHA